MGGEFRCCSFHPVSSGGLLAMLRFSGQDFFYFRSFHVAEWQRLRAIRTGGREFPHE
jgi:hypothetical protein